MSHIPVLLQEMIKYLDPQENKYYLDCTFGAGGYSKEILKSSATVYACDQDISTKHYFDVLKTEFPNKIFFYHSNFSEVDKLLEHDDINELDGIVMDLGVSSMQIDDGERGFSFNKDGPLDMRMNKDTGQSASDFVNTASLEDLADVIYYYGDERDAKKIARAIVKHREATEITTTLQLAKIIKSVVHQHPKQKIDPATKTFQAIRIFINDEMNSLITGMQKLVKMLKINGKMIVVSFHSTEDRIVKKFFQNMHKKNIDKNYRFLGEDFYSNCDFEVEKDILLPTEYELDCNIRSRSAKMRILKRTR
jgi:16S rRNA (cytosine1402-N4)-methyltransferase